MHNLTLKQAQKKLASGEITSVELTESVIDRINKIEPSVLAFITTSFDVAREEAKKSDQRRREGKAFSTIDGVSISLKDVFATKDILTTAGSKILGDFVPFFDATVVKKLKEAGCIIIGKTNLDEFAMGSSTENSAYQTTHNPWDLDRVPGGSSGGSAVAVVSGESIFSLGTDTGGSIRQPSNFCNAVGLKVTYGLCSRYGVIPYASSFDTIGPITKTVEDSAIVLNQIAGNDPLDSTTTKNLIPDYTKYLSQEIKGKKIGMPVEFFGEGIDGEVRKIIEDAKKTLISLGAEVREVSLPLTKYAIACYYILAKAEASSNLSRYDGIRYGKTISNNEKLITNNLEELYFDNRTEGFGDEAKRSIMMGTYTLSSGYFDAYYLKASKVRTKIMKEYEDVFKKYDVLITPVSPFPAFKIGEKLDDPLSMYLADVFTVPINVAGVPAISIPAGFTKDNLPVGLQIVAPKFGEDKLFQIANAFESATNYHLKKPNIN